MDVVEIIAIIILVLAVLFLIYYYLNNLKSFNTTGTTESIKGFFNSPTTSEGDVNKSNTSDNVEVNKDDEDEEKVSTVDKIKYSFKDIDMAAALNTDAFSKRLDAFLDEKSEELIENWSLATTSDLNSLEERCELACNTIDDLEKRFSEYSDVTDSKLEDLDKRLKALEDEE